MNIARIRPRCPTLPLHTEQLQERTRDIRNFVGFVSGIQSGQIGCDRDHVLVGQIRHCRRH